MRYRLRRGIWIHSTVLGIVSCLLAIAPSASAQPPMNPTHLDIASVNVLVPDEPIELPARFDSFRLIRMNPRSGETFEQPIDPPGSNGGAPRGGVCPPVVLTHSSADFAGGQFVIQAGFVENEILAASYVLDPAEFPITVDLMETVFATSNATVVTTTQWSVMVWEGTPSDANLPIVTFSSDGITLLPVTLGPGTEGALIQVGVDPADPPIVVQNDGSNTFSVGFRIDAHNNPPVVDCNCAFNICLTPAMCCPPSTATNAFPTTDTITPPPNSLTGNYLRCLDGCDPLAAGLACPGGWHSFANLGSFRPSGDWNIRATYTPFCVAATGACCLAGGGCNEQLSQVDCETIGGTYLGDAVPCLATSCDGACCTGASCSILGDEAACTAAGGVFQGVGVPCGTGIGNDPNPCAGACCLADGTCQDNQTQTSCDAIGGAYKGDGQTCLIAGCSGACCFQAGACSDLDLTACQSAGGSWQGPATSCQTFTCPTTGACCFLDGTCQDVALRPACDALGGEYAGDGSLCSNQPCIGACCVPAPSTFCISEDASNCIQLGGTPQGLGTTCVGAASDVCPVGACCLPSGSCTDGLRIAECTTLGGAFQGDGTLCAQVSCPQPIGACCLAAGGCLADQVQATCEAFGNTWAGQGTICPDACAPPCPGADGDLTGNGSTDGSDIGVFVDAVINGATPAQECHGNFDGVNGLDVGDIPGMVAAMLAG